MNIVHFLLDLNSLDPSSLSLLFMYGPQQCNYELFYLGQSIQISKSRCKKFVFQWNLFWKLLHLIDFDMLNSNLRLALFYDHQKCNYEFLKLWQSIEISKSRGKKFVFCILPIFVYRSQKLNYKFLKSGHVSWFLVSRQEFSIFGNIILESVSSYTP